MAKLGYAAKAVVHACIGVIALLAALGTGEHTVGTRETLLRVLAQPSGKWLLGLLALGLFSYAVWRFVQAFVDTDHEGTHPRAIVVRVGFAFAGLIYAGLAMSAVELLVSEGLATSEDQQARIWTARLFAEPFGHWLVAGLGLAMVGFAIRELRVTGRGLFPMKLKFHEMTKAEKTLAMRCRQVGRIARAVVLALIGFCLVKASIYSNPQEARGLGGALRLLEQHILGRWILAGTALGLIAYALYLLLLVVYRRIVRQ